MAMADARHKRIFNKQALGTIPVVLLWGLFSIVTMFQHGSNQSNYERDTDKAHLYRVMSGDENRAGPQVSERFASDINSLIESDTDEQPLSDSLDAFVAGPNDYGGIDKALGYNPYDNSGLQCDVCGSLSDEMKSRIEIIAEGGVEDLIASELDLTPPTFNPLLYMAGSALYYLVTSTGVLVFTVWRDCKQHGYKSMELNWKNTGGTVADKYKQLSKVLAPGYAVVLRIRKGQSKDYQGVVRQINLEQEYLKIKEMAELAKSLPEGERQRYEQKCAALLADIDEQVADVVRPDHTFETNSVEVLRERIHEELERSSIGILARKEALKELQTDHDGHKQLWRGR